MKKDLKEKILKESEQLFLTNGYSATSMRQIADACQIAVGNLCYHYPKKEDILMAHHDHLIEVFSASLPKKGRRADPLTLYFAAEYRFVFYIAFDEPTRKLYTEVINLPLLRDSYCRNQHDLFLRFVPEGTFSCTDAELFLSTIAMCALEFQTIERLELYMAAQSFDDLMRRIFETRLLFLNKDPKAYEETIARGIKLGKASA